MLRNFFLSFFFLTFHISALAQQLIYFEGNNAISSDALLSAYKACTTEAGAPDEKKDAERIRIYCLQRNVLRYVWSQGYLNAKVGAAEKQDDGRFRVMVEEGIRYRLGDVKISGVKAFSPEQLRQRLSLKTGDIADGEKLSDFVFDSIKAFYGEAGYIQSTAEFEPVFRDEGIADININIDEGLIFTLRRIEIVGNMYVRDRVVRDAMLIGSGDIFDLKQFDESIKSINKLGLFEPIDKNTNIELHVDQDRGDVDIVVKVVERRRQ